MPGHGACERVLRMNEEVGKPHDSGVRAGGYGILEKDEEGRGSAGWGRAVLSVPCGDGVAEMVAPTP